MTLPEGVSTRDAALIEPLSCAVRGYDVLRMRLADHVLIYGSGTMGLMMLQLAKRSGAGTVDVVDLNPERLETARQLGCCAAVANADEIERPRGWDVVIDCTGVVAAIEDGLKRVAKAGTFLQFGVTDYSARVTIEPYRIYNQEITITGSMAVNQSYERAAELFLQGVVDPAVFISDRLRSTTTPRRSTACGAGSAARSRCCRVMRQLILTVTLNLALDVTYFPPVRCGGGQPRGARWPRARAARGSTSRACCGALGHDAVVTGFVGGRTGDAVRADLARRRPRRRDRADRGRDAPDGRRGTRPGGEPTGFWEPGPRGRGGGVDGVRRRLPSGWSPTRARSCSPAACRAACPTTPTRALIEIAAAGVPAVLDADGRGAALPRSARGRRSPSPTATSSASLAPGARAGRGRRARCAPRAPRRSSSRSAPTGCSP